MTAAGPPSDASRMEDYKVTVDVWHQYVDARFRLLQLVPLASGVGVALVGERLSYVSALISAGALISLLGVVMYDLRNSVLHDAAVHRAKALERQIGFDHLTGVHKPGEARGVFSDRPHGRIKFFGIVAWHDRALALIYSTAAAAWTAILIASLITEWDIPQAESRRWIVAGTGAVLAFAAWFDAISRFDRNAEDVRSMMKVK